MSSGESRSRSDPERDSLTGQALRWPSAGDDCIAERGLGRGAEDRAAVGSGADTERSKGRRELWEVRSGEPDVGQILEAPRTQRAVQTGKLAGRGPVCLGGRAAGCESC